ncbi:nucleotide exchange factor GrpE [Oceanobacillus halotolerans]|uniref:nucleotide exchange factor GrpE n=1 Tax=Oceanobacillus halotolerans TaxID=2663380 RepID=UPI0013D95835|nr:nucleotide exchange factor GrpE [Oceanobacillus halotolerans]
MEEKNEAMDTNEETVRNNTENIEEVDQETDQSEPEVEVIDSSQEEKQHLESDEAKLAQLQADVERLQKEKDQANEKMLRIQAEFDNFKKRTQKEKEAASKYKAQDIITELLPAIDNFERALQVEVTETTASFVEGMTMVYQQLKDALKAQGVEEIETVGKPFDPTIHHAVMQIEDEEQGSDIVVEELQKGYILKDRVIRPAMVKVNK